LGFLTYTWKMVFLGVFGCFLIQNLLTRKIDVLWLKFMFITMKMWFYAYFTPTEKLNFYKFSKKISTPRGNIYSGKIYSPFPAVYWLMGWLASPYSIYSSLVGLFRSHQLFSRFAKESG
jgi:hypothetical protein